MVDLGESFLTLPPLLSFKTLELDKTSGLVETFQQSIQIAPALVGSLETFRLFPSSDGDDSMTEDEMSRVPDWILAASRESLRKITLIV